MSRLMPFDRVTAHGVCGVWRVDRVIGNYAQLSSAVPGSDASAQLFVHRLKRVAP